MSVEKNPYEGIEIIQVPAKKSANEVVIKKEDWNVPFTTDKSVLNSFNVKDKGKK